MMYGKTFKTLLAITGVIGVAFAAPQTDSDELNNEVAGGFINKKGESVSASWGGFHAAATLNDDGTAVASAGGNGLGASSGYGSGGAGAGAGVFGTGAVSGVGSTSGSTTPVKPIGGKPQNAGGSQLYHQGGGAGNGFFDRIFAIPINVLQSVNTYLNQKQQLQGQPGAAHGHPTTTNNNIHGSASAAGASATAGSASYANGAGKAPGASAATAAGDYGHDSAAAASATAGNGKPGSPMMVQTKTNYDDIFNIPITALRSVQNLLNG